MKAPTETVQRLLDEVEEGRYGSPKILGKGGMGMVWRVTDHTLGRAVAIKHMVPTQAGNPELRHRFLMEVQVLEKLDHPGFPAVHRVEEEPVPLFVMDYMPGISLRRVVRDRGAQTAEQVRDWLGQAAAALAHAHERGVVHRDVKPENLLVSEDDKLAIIDFGIAADQGCTRITRSGFGVGTPAYMCPEQIRGEDPTPRNDIFSLAATGVFLLTARPPPRKDARDGEVKLGSLPPGLGGKLEGALLAGLESDPEKRPASMLAFAARLGAGSF